MSVDVRTYLESKGLHLRSAGPDDVHTTCWYCGEDPSKRGRLYINVGPDENLAGLYMCHRCGEKGNLKLLRKHFGDPPLDDKSDEGGPLLPILNAAADYYHKKLDQPTIDFLKKERGLTLETMERHQLGIARSGDEAALGKYLHNECGFPLEDMRATGLIVERGDKLKDFLYGHITIPYHVQGQVVQIRGKEIGGKYFTPPRQKARLYNVDGVWDAERVFIAEGEFDALVLEQAGYTAVGAPGAISWQATWNGYFDEVRRIFCVFDNDRAGNEGAKKLEEIFGTRMKRVELPTLDDGSKQDVTDWMVTAGHTPAEFDELISDAVVRNSILVTPAQALEEWTTVQGVDGLKLGWSKFDEYIRPGLLPAQVMVVLAKTNVGKTLALLNMFQGVARCQPDAKVLFVSLEQTRGDWFERAQRIWQAYNISCPPEDVRSETVKFWTPRLRIVDKNRVSEDQLLGAIEEFEAEMGQVPDLVAVDYLGYWAGSFPSRSRYEQVGDAVMSLKAVAKEKRIPIITPHQVSRMAEFGAEPSIDQARDSGAVEETADFVIALWSKDNANGVAPENRTGILHAKIGKSRHGGKGNGFDLRLAPISLFIVDSDDAVRNAWIDREFKLSMTGGGIDWQDVMKEHSTGTHVLLNAEGKYQVPKEWKLDQLTVVQEPLLGEVTQ